jgi:hypothetical protein
MLVEIRNPEELEAWLKKQPDAVAVALAARAALRVLPLVHGAKAFKSYREGIVLPVVRAAAISWVVAKYPARAMQLEAAARSATYACNRVFVVANNYSARTAATAAAYAARATYGAITADAATAAHAAGDAAGDAAAALWSAVSADATRIEKQATASGVASDMLWPNSGSASPYGVPEPLWSLWQEMEAALVAANEDWQVWTKWYGDRLRSSVQKDEWELAYVQIDDALWDQGPAAVNAEIKRRIEALERPNLTAEQPTFQLTGGSLEITVVRGKTEPQPPQPPPPEPAPEPGPMLQVTERGLEIIPQPIEGDFDQELQKALHHRLQRLLLALKDMTQKAANQHPALDHVISEYSDLIAEPFDKLDVASLWAVGTGLLAFRAAFASQASGTMAEPLEPGHFALLQQAAELHGGFILGFPKGRELTDRADQARLSPEIVGQIEPPAHRILEKLAGGREFVEPRTRRILAAIDESLIANGWGVARIGHAAYTLTKNSLIALGKVVIQLNKVIATGAAGALFVRGLDPDLIKHIIQFMFDNAQTIASFAEPFPELRNWLTFLIDHIDREKQDP